MTRQTWAIASVALLASSQLFAADVVTRKSDGKKLSESGRHEPGDPTHPGIDREHHH